jgi:hypothetical protein
MIGLVEMSEAYAVRISMRSTFAIPAAISTDRAIANGHSRLPAVATRGGDRLWGCWSSDREDCAFAVEASHTKPKYDPPGSLKCPDFPVAQ